MLIFDSRHINRQHSSRPLKDLIFAPPHFEKIKKELPTLNFLSRFLSSASFSTFAVYFLLCVEKITHNKKLAKPPTAKELNPTHKTKTRAKKFSLSACASWTALYLSIVLFSVDNVSAQNIQTPQTPKFEEFKSSNINPHYTNSNLNQQNVSQKNPYGSSMGATSDDIINQTNRIAEQQMGRPVYKAGGTPQENQEANMRYIQERMRNDPMYQMPNNNNGFKNPAFEKNKELLNILNEVHLEEKNTHFDMNYFKSTEFSTKTKSYTEALQYFKDVFAGKKKLSVANAYFVIENAYGNAYLTKKEYDNILNEGADFIQKWMIQNGYNINDNEAKNMSIQKFLSETLTITIDSPDGIKPPQKITHNPFFYDYEDFKGEKDYRNYFTTKSLATGSGQCNSLPAVYNSYAEKIGAKSYLTFAPLHSFNKYPDNNGKIHSYEPTSNWNISDKWYSDNMFISPKAKVSGIYLDTLNRKQIVANCVIDLAFGYLKKHGAANGEFVKECLALAVPSFPKGNNIQAYFVYSSLLARQIDRALNENNITDLKNIDKFPEVAKLYQALMKNEEIIKQLGYQDTPEQLYEEMMQQQEFKGKRQQEKNINGKEKRSLFIKSF